MNESKKFRRLALWVKIRRWGITVLIAILVVLAAMPVAYKLTQMRAAKESNEIMRTMEMDNELMAPNIEVSDHYLGNTSVMGGQVISHRYKDIEGYRIPWSPVIQNYSWLTSGGGDALSNATDQSTTALYDRVTEQKIPMFFNARATRPNLKATHDLRKVAATKGAVVEMALTFKQPLTYQQVRAKLPAKVHPQWYWIGVSGTADPTSMDNNLLGYNVKNLAHPERLSQDNYRRFYLGLVKAGETASGMSYDGFNIYKYAGQYAKRYPKGSQAKFAGVIVTGNSEGFQSLTKANWIYASSAGFFRQRSVIK